MTLTQAPWRWLIPAVVLVVAVAVALTIALWPRSTAEEARDRCGIGEVRDGALVVTVPGADGSLLASENLGCVLHIYGAPVGAQFDLTAQVVRFGLEHINGGPDEKTVDFGVSSVTIGYVGTDKTLTFRD